MAELLSSSDEEGDAPVRFSSPHGGGNIESSIGGGGFLTAALDATDRSQSEDLFELLLSTSRQTVVWKGNGGFQAATARSPYASKAGNSNRYSDAAGAIAEQTKKPVISAREMLLKLFPASSQSSTMLIPVPATTSPTMTTYAASKRDSFGSSAGECHRSSRSVMPTQQTPDGESSSTLSASERIAMKYGLLRFQSPGASANSAAGSRQRELVGKEKAAYQTLATEATPVVRRPAVEPKETPERSPFWNVEARKEAESKTAVTSTYVSPFASKDGFIDMKRRRRQSGENGVQYHDLPSEAVYGDSKREGVEIGNRPRHVVASSITASKDVSGENADSDDGWMSDAKDIAMEQQEERARARATSLAGSLKNQRMSALPLTKVQSKSLKRPRKRHSGSDNDELAPEDIDRWPRLPFPEVCDLDFYREVFSFAYKLVYFVSSLSPQSMQGPLTLISSEGDGHAATVCANINSFLFDYQREGTQFLYDAYSKDTGAILGDEMGLGKTIQVIAFVAAILGKRGDFRDKEAWRQLRSQRREAVANMPLGEQETVFDTVPGPCPLLIVVPASLLHNWEAELRTWLCCCTVILHGKPEERDAIVKQIPRYV